MKGKGTEFLPEYIQKIINFSGIGFESYLRKERDKK